MSKIKEQKEGLTSREAAMIAYCSGKKIRASPIGGGPNDDYDAWLVGHAPWVRFRNESYPGRIPLFTHSGYIFEIAKEPPTLVDGLEACKAYREGKTIRCNSRNYKSSDCGSHPNFVVDGWEVL